MLDARPGRGAKDESGEVWQARADGARWEERDVPDVRDSAPVGEGGEGDGDGQAKKELRSVEGAAESERGRGEPDGFVGSHRESRRQAARSG